MRNHYENDFDLHENETACRTHFHMKGFAFSLDFNRGKRELGNVLFIELGLPSSAVEHCSANTEAMGSNPVNVLKMFFGLKFAIA